MDSLPGMWIVTAAFGVIAAGFLASAPQGKGSLSAADRDRAEQLESVIAKLRPLHAPLGKPGPSDWLAHHKEPGQTFAEYLRCRPVLPRDGRTVIYVQPLGEFTEPQRKIVTLTAEFLGLYFNLKVAVQRDLPSSTVPARARRIHPSWGDKQILTSYVLDDVLRPRLLADAAACIALTASDLWPGEGWNFVFGQASLEHRVGVWSLYRNGDPAESPESFRLCMLRTLKTAAHETGHMFSMLHCTAYQCNMCGSNHRQEADSRPIALCPECLAKVCWAARAEPVPRFQKLEEFCRKQELTEQAEFYRRSLKALGAEPLPAAAPTSAPSSFPDDKAVGKSPTPGNKP